MSSQDGDVFVYELAERALDESFQRRLEDFTSKVSKRDLAREVTRFPYLEVESHPSILF